MAIHGQAEKRVTDMQMALCHRHYYQQTTAGFERSFADYGS